MEKRPARIRGVLCILASAAGFALMGFFVRLADDFGAPAGAIQKSVFRNVVAFAVAAVAFARSRRRTPAPAARPTLPPGTVPLLVLRSIAGTLGIFGNFYALSHLPLGDATMLNKLSPFFTILFAAAFLGERAGPARFACVAGAFAGAALVAKPGFGIDDPLAVLAGAGSGMAAGAAYACVRTLGRRGVPGSLIVLFFSGFSTLAALPFAALSFVPMSGAQIAILSAAGLSAAAGQFGITAAYRYAPPRDIAVFDYTNVVFAAALGFAFLGQIPDPLSVAGYALIVAMAAVSARAK